MCQYYQPFGFIVSDVCTDALRWVLSRVGGWISVPSGPCVSVLGCLGGPAEPGVGRGSEPSAPAQSGFISPLSPDLHRQPGALGFGWHRGVRGQGFASQTLLSVGIPRGCAGQRPVFWEASCFEAKAFGFVRREERSRELRPCLRQLECDDTVRPLCPSEPSLTPAGGGGRWSSVSLRSTRGVPPAAGTVSR